MLCHGLTIVGVIAESDLISFQAPCDPGDESCENAKPLYFLAIIALRGCCLYDFAVGSEGGSNECGGAGKCPCISPAHRRAVGTSESERRSCLHHRSWRQPGSLRLAQPRPLLKGTGAPRRQDLNATG